MSTAVSHDVDGPSANKNWWWFNDNNKEDVDTLLDEADRRATIAEEAGGFQKKCAYCLVCDFVGSRDMQTVLPKILSFSVMDF